MNTLNSLSKKELNFGMGILTSMCVGSIFAHEYSHMTAMRALFSNVNPYMSCVFSKFSCSTNWGGLPVIRPELSGLGLWVDLTLTLLMLGGV